MKKVIVILAIVCSAFAVQAQTKVAHINRTELIQSMPEFTAIKDKLAAETNEWQSLIKEKEDDIRAKYEKYKEQEAKLSPEMLEIKAAELEKLQDEYQQLQQQGTQALQTSENKMIAPLVKKVDETIGIVAKEKGYDYVMDSSEGSGIIYKNASNDLMTAVKAKLSLN